MSFLEMGSKAPPPCRRAVPSHLQVFQQHWIYSSRYLNYLAIVKVMLRLFGGINTLSPLWP